MRDILEELKELSEIIRSETDSMFSRRDAAIVATASEVERLRNQVNSAIVHANCVINGHSGSCNRETWRTMVEKLGQRVVELPESETYEHEIS